MLRLRCVLRKRVIRTLIIAGPGNFEKEFGFKPWDNVELFGVANVEETPRIAIKGIGTALFVHLLGAVRRCAY